jgi:hypothetical protein
MPFDVADERVSVGWEGWQWLVYICLKFFCLLRRATIGRKIRGILRIYDNRAKRNRENGPIEDSEDDFFESAGISKRNF